MHSRERSTSKRAYRGEQSVEGRGRGLAQRLEQALRGAPLLLQHLCQQVAPGPHELPRQRLPRLPLRLLQPRPHSHQPVVRVACPASRPARVVGTTAAGDAPRVFSEGILRSCTANQATSCSASTLNPACCRVTTPYSAWTTAYDAGALSTSSASAPVAFVEPAVSAALSGCESFAASSSASAAAAAETSPGSALPVPAAVVAAVAAVSAAASIAVGPSAAPASSSVSSSSSGGSYANVCCAEANSARVSGESSASCARCPSLSPSPSSLSSSVCGSTSSGSPSLLPCRCSCCKCDSCLRMGGSSASCTSCSVKGAVTVALSSPSAGCCSGVASFTSAGASCSKYACRCCKNLRRLGSSGDSAKLVLAPLVDPNKPASTSRPVSGRNSSE
eukprot:scaffold6691_cov358-Prasinococcus_capsulatus_cf.AAC.11